MRRFGDCRTFLDKSRLSNLGEQMMFWRTLFWQICGGVILLCHKKKVQKLHSLAPLLLKLVSLHHKSSVTFRKLIQPHSCSEADTRMLLYWRRYIWSVLRSLQQAERFYFQYFSKINWFCIFYLIESLLLGGVFADRNFRQFHDIYKIHKFLTNLFWETSFWQW